MLPFRPANSKIRRQKKYFSQKKTSKQNQRSIFQLPKQIFAPEQLSNYKFINPQNSHSFNLKNENKSERQFVIDYQDNLRRTAFSHSKQITKNKLSHKKLNSSQALQDTVYSSFMRNKKTKSGNNSMNKMLAFKTLNILYRTIIQTKFVKKPKTSFQLNASQLPIIERKYPKKKQPSKQKDIDLQKDNTLNQLLKISNKKKHFKLQLQDKGELRPWGGRFQEQWFY